MRCSGSALLFLSIICAFVFHTSFGDDEVWTAIAEDIQREQQDHALWEQELLLDDSRAKEAETLAEAAAAAAEKEKEKLAAQHAKTAQEQRGPAPNADLKPGSTVKPESLLGLLDSTKQKNRDRIPQRTKQNSYGDEFSTTSKDPRTKTQGPFYQQDLEELLNQDLRLVNSFEKQRQVREAAINRSEKKFALVSRKFARPIEQLMTKLDQSATYYQLLNVWQGARPEEIKQAFRGLAMTLHPDKNPHPDAKAAFSAVQEAYDTLMNPSTRITYDNSLRRRPKPYQRVMRATSNFVENTYARSLLFWKRARTGELHIELKEFKEVLRALFAKTHAMLTRIAIQPTLTDRVYLVGELAWDNKFKVAAFLSAASWMMRTRR